MAQQLNTENLVRPMTNAVAAALEQSRTTLSGIEIFKPIDKETALDQTFRFNLWLADFVASSIGFSSSYPRKEVESTFTPSRPYLHTGVPS